MIGIVLSGGESSRMGQDKGLLQFKETIWAQIVRENLKTLSIPTFVSINPQQLIPYSAHFNKEDLIIDQVGLQIAGPLAGLMSVHSIYPEQDIVVVACDMIHLKSMVLEKLVEEYGVLQPEAMAFKGIRIEPLCAIYSSRGLRKIKVRYDQRALTKHSMIHVLESLDTIYVQLIDEWLPFFKNFNQAGDLNEILN